MHYIYYMLINIQRKPTAWVVEGVTGDIQDLGSIPGPHTFHIIFAKKYSRAGSVVKRIMHLQKSTCHVHPSTRSTAMNWSLWWTQVNAYALVMQESKRATLNGPGFLKYTSIWGLIPPRFAKSCYFLFLFIIFYLFFSLLFF